MSLTREQYDSIMFEYSRIRLSNSREMARRRAEVQRKIPSYDDAARTIVGSGVELLRKSLGSGTSFDRESFALEEKKAEAVQHKLLADNGFDVHYLDPIYTCPYCHDTGYVGNEKCRCFRAKEITLLYHQSRIQELAEAENFETLSRKWYKGEDLTNFVRAEEASRTFVRQFGRLYQNLFFYGNVGTGKSFLSICIAHEILQQGHSVIYFSAAELFGRLSALAFDRNHREDLFRLQNDLYTCDLLIIDDLGTEGTNSFVVSQLFALINERHLSSHPTIISSNLSMKDLSSAYTERISSRILSYYGIYKLTGVDIRIQKRYGSN